MLKHLTHPKYLLLAICSHRLSSEAFQPAKLSLTHCFKAGHLGGDLQHKRAHATFTRQGQQGDLGSHLC